VDIRQTHPGCCPFLIQGFAFPMARIPTNCLHTFEPGSIRAQVDHNSVRLGRIFCQLGLIFHRVDQSCAHLCANCQFLELLHLQKNVTQRRRLLNVVGYSTSAGYSTSSTLSTIKIRRLSENIQDYWTSPTTRPHQFAYFIRFVCW
jgi:hypothetical protein